MHDYDFGQCTFDEEYDFLFLQKNNKSGRTAQ